MISVSYIITRALDFYALLIVAYVILSWFARGGGAVFEIYRTLGTLCEPYIGVFRRIVPTTGGLDFSPLVALLVLQYIIRPVVAVLLGSLGL
jgi:uncharacterized protein YggT (Ycf19 family)